MSYLKELLNIYWLRPEIALWRALDCALMNKYSVDEPSLDMGAGDGSLSYIMAGGRFKKDFDIYRLVETTDDFTKGNDIYNTTFGIKQDLIYENNPVRHRFTVGIDHKENLLKKALLLPGFYRTVLSYNLDKKLPFKPESFRSIFSNILYWLTDLDKVLTGINDVLCKKGKTYLFVPNKNFKELAWIYYKEVKPAGYGYLKFIDRGYSPLIKHCYDFKKWKGIFKRNGFSILEHKQYLSRHIMEIWNIGTRPISHLLINMSGRMDEQNRARTKSEWIDFFSKFFSPLVKAGFRKDSVSGAAFHFFVLEKD